MAKYAFIYHGGNKPKTPEAIQQVMQAWNSWFESIGNDVIDDGAPVGMSTTVHSDGSVTSDGGSNPVSGYSLIEAGNRDDAIAKAKGCPILQAGGSVELAEAIAM